MKRGRLITIEGTDASGKETQTNILYNRFLKEKIPIAKNTFPMYNTPSGKIVGGPFLGKPEISKSYFEKPSLIDPKAASFLYVFDRRINLPKLESVLNSGTNLILNRYVGSNMGMQGGKIRDSKERKKFYLWLEKLEYEMAELPKPDLTIFLHMPYDVGIELKSRMDVKKDEVEKDIIYLKNSEEAYLQLSDLYNWSKVLCTTDGTIHTLKSKDQIEKEIWRIVKKDFNN